MKGSLSTHDDPSALFVEHDGQFLRQHPNGGGLVSLNATVSERVFVGPHASVLDSASIDGNYYLVDECVVAGHARLRGGGRLKHCARVDGNASLKGFVIMSHTSRVTDDAILEGTITLEYAATITGQSHLHGPMLISG